jgi:tetratricopeptide (TPR) repeat protein
VPVTESTQWTNRLRFEPHLCNTQEVEILLDRHRAFARATGDSRSLVITFNAIAHNVAAAQPAWAIALIKEAMDWEPYEPRNWTVYARTLWQAEKHDEALSVLWQAKQRFPWNPFCRNDLGARLQDMGDTEASKAVYRETSIHLPDDVVCRNALANLLIQLDELDEAERVLQEARQIDSADDYSRNLSRNLLAEAWFVKSARTNDTSLRERARALLEESARTLDSRAIQTLHTFDRWWSHAVQQGGSRFFGKEIGEKRALARSIADMSPAERLGRAMIALQQAERAISNDERNQHCHWADKLLALPDTEAGDLLPPLVETRGLVLLARRDVVAAHRYFIDQVERYGRANWIGVRLGLERAGLLLGNVTTELPEFDWVRLFWNEPAGPCQAASWSGKLS